MATRRVIVFTIMILASVAAAACSQSPTVQRSTPAERVAPQLGPTRTTPPAAPAPKRPAPPTIRGNATAQRAPGSTVEQRLANLGFSAEVHSITTRYPKEGGRR